MKNKKITRKITQGMYVLTTKDGGCMVDAVSQISIGDNPLFAVAVMNKNYTNQLLKQTNHFGLSILGVKVDPSIIEIFGLHSMRDINKFKHIQTTLVENIPIIYDSLGYLILEKVDMIENETHTLFIGKLIEADLFKDQEPMSYGYYQEHKEELIKVKTENGKTAWVCTVCGYVYYEEELKDDFTCPVCGVPKELFEKR